MRNTASKPVWENKWNKKKILIQSKKKVKKYRIIKEKCKTNMNHKRMVKNNSKIIITINKNN